MPRLASWNPHSACLLCEGPSFSGGRAAPLPRRDVASTDPVGDLGVPFGGVKLSGFGRGTSPHALDEYGDLETTWINHG
ncbi:hypothetical protein GCM10009798_07840 [Nocardioides panacihumi]|uniref:Aldehyde dehydrogenase family protein n=1 Tax=Nocardioides panacihumi TaxID=400774 RepID=A0ABP5BVE0_9ACTN